MIDYKPNSTKANQATGKALVRPSEEFQQQQQSIGNSGQEISDSLQQCTSKVTAKYATFYQRLRSVEGLSDSQKRGLLKRYISGEVTNVDKKWIKATYSRNA